MGLRNHLQRLLILLALALTVTASLPARAQGAIFQDFYWDTVSPVHGEDWWTYTAKQLPALAQAGVAAVWVPDPVKGGTGKFDMGYGPYDLYDLGCKDQKGTVATSFGTKEEFLRFCAIAHANGIRVVVDAVLNHAMGCDYAEENPVMANLGWDDIPDDSKVPSDLLPPGYTPQMNLRSWTGFVPKGEDGKLGTGRFPRHWMDFHPGPTEPDRDPPYHVQELGSDYSFNADNYYVQLNMIAWSDWFIDQTGIDGYRMDDVKGLDPYFSTAFCQAAHNHNPFFIVGEYLDGDAGKTTAYLNAMDKSMSLFDYPLCFALHDMTFRPEEFDMRDLLKRRLPDRAHAVTSIDNHDMSRSYPIATNRLLAQAIVLSMSGTPCVHYSDFWRSTALARRTLTRLIWIHNHFATGAETIREADKDTLAIQRAGGLLALFNSGGDYASHTVSVPTGLAPQIRLVNLVAASIPESLQVDLAGTIQVTVAPFTYALFAPQGLDLEAQRQRSVPLPVAIIQTTEFAYDLDTGKLSIAPHDVLVTVAKATRLRAELKADREAGLVVEILTPNARVLHRASGGSEFAATDTHTPITGRYFIRCLATSGPIHGYVTISYTAPL